MADSLSFFERIVRRAGEITEAPSVPTGGMHPFDERDIHPALPKAVRDLFDDGHYTQATFEAFKFIDKEIRRHSGSVQSGWKLMMDAFNEDNPLIKLTSGQTPSEKDEQRGFRHIFAGSDSAIRNPRAHEVDVSDSPDECLDHLALASLLLRRLEQAGYKCVPGEK